MKTHTHRIRNMMVYLGILFMVAVFSSCATKADFLSSSVVPAAKGTVIVKEDDNKNYQIKVDVTNLANSKDLSPPRNVYVLWMRTNKDEIKNLGQIVSSTSSISNKLKASFETVSFDKPIKIFITAENEADVQFPDSEMVLFTDLISLK
ncbi:MAG: hypothetical protein R6U95_05490 [Bacteroidales bacterium]